MRSVVGPALIAILCLSLAGCGDDGTAEDTTADAFVPTDEGTPPMACEPMEPACVDEQIPQLDLKETVNMASVTNEDAGDGITRTTVDSTGGGLTPTESYVYLRFTDAGLERVDVSDLDAFESTEWDIAARRFVIRLNSGVSGPSCVTAARTAGGTELATLDAEPDGLTYRTEEYFQPDCSFVSDGSGIGSPAVALASFWTYSSCVQMSGNVYVLELASGRKVKLEVETYYSPENQDICDSTGSVPRPSGSGNLQILWAFLD